ncbi:methylornithine synthase PylB [Candidatus Formimonas warabiya]|uniref:Methylornithine synthase PylB n=1 Tax=Formimonas warabiya TaxID=1761012 RepID=A0A3G1KQG3_FORW1|nr:methylornithine synthase PylB [Candidatus Formimonas warabiya]ATW24709.1 methylornithine synthase PylB [Candidatus Formimonas warabiya]
MIQIDGYDYLAQILDRAYHEITLSKKEILYLLGLNRQEEISQIFSTARRLRCKHFENKIFLYGFVYFSTHCRNDCSFCLYRKSNQSLSRYRKNEAEIVETASSLAESGVHLLDLTMGEDPEFILGDARLDKLCGIIEKVKKSTDLPLMISPGVVPQRIMKEFKRLGVNWYALYQETHTPELYAKLRLYQDYEERFAAKEAAHRIGMLIEEGILTGIGDTDLDVANSLLNMENLGAEQVRVMTFVPQKQTPMGEWTPPSRMRELIIIAVMRLMFPDRLIPASLDVDGINGLKQRLDAGANVVTSIIPPQAGLAGVSNSDLDIEDGNRTVKRVTETLEELGLAPASAMEYINWVNKRQRMVKRVMGGVI